MYERRDSVVIENALTYEVNIDISRGVLQIRATYAQQEDAEKIADFARRLKAEYFATEGDDE